MGEILGCFFLVFLKMLIIFLILFGINCLLLCLVMEISFIIVLINYGVIDLLYFGVIF